FQNKLFKKKLCYLKIKRIFSYMFLRKNYNLRIICSFAYIYIYIYIYIWKETTFWNEKYIYFKFKLRHNFFNISATHF
ncbi:MAG: hypothetical protein N7Q72_02195, partial [Spiroplasma sp. Tabriz.8]|nr:hypothetical protein [Spiroplasma sp. Tabriz.8]